MESDVNDNDDDINNISKESKHMNNITINLMIRKTRTTTLFGIKRVITLLKSCQNLKSNIQYCLQYTNTN